MKRYRAELNTREFIIEEDLPQVGWYLYVYENGKCTKDFLQDTFEIAMNQAKELFGVQVDKWIEITEDKKKENK